MAGRLRDRCRAATVHGRDRDAMMSGRTYLDWNASAPLRPEARAAVSAALDLPGNASSVHAEGRKLRGIIEGARDDVARLVGADAADVVFTSGATEANAAVMAGGWDRIFVAGIEHDSVLQPARASGVTIVDVGAAVDGVAMMERMAEQVLGAGTGLGRALVSLQLANNETGVLQPVAETAAFCRSHGVSFHTDAVQAAGRIAIDVAALDVDYLSLSAHKIGGPKGIGALVLRDGAALRPLIAGGGQERRRRGGTENVAAIAGFGAAARAARMELAEMETQRARRDMLERAVLQVTPTAVVIGGAGQRLANTSCIAVPGTAAETLVIKLDLAGIAVSAGSACSSGKVGYQPRAGGDGCCAGNRERRRPDQYWRDDDGRRYRCVHRGLVYDFWREPRWRLDWSAETGNWRI